jgi:hypothetical protein
MTASKRRGWLARIRSWFDEELPEPPDIDEDRAELALEDEGLTEAEAEQRRALRMKATEKEGKGSYR